MRTVGFQLPGCYIRKIVHFLRCCPYPLSGLWIDIGISIQCLTNGRRRNTQRFRNVFNRYHNADSSFLSDAPWPKLLFFCLILRICHPKSFSHFHSKSISSSCKQLVFHRCLSIILYEIHISLIFSAALFTTFVLKNIIICSENVFVNSLIFDRYFRFFQYAEGGFYEIRSFR